MTSSDSVSVDLVHLHEDRVCDALVDPALQELIRDEVVADELEPIAQRVGETLQSPHAFSSIPSSIETSGKRSTSPV
jgi:hypothetical protein